MKRVLLSLVAALALLGVLSSSTFAAETQRGRPTHVYVVHGIPGVNVDVYVNGQLALPNFKPGDTVGPINMPIGCCTKVSIYAAGANPSQSQPVLEANAPLPATRGVSIVAHLKADGTPTLSLFTEMPEERAPRGFGKVNVRHTAAFGAVDLWAAPASGGDLAKIASGLTNPNSLNLVLPAGSYRVAVVPAGAPVSSAALTATISVFERQTLNVYAIGNPTASPSTFGAVVQTLR